MKISLSWLKELIDYQLSPQELADQLSLKSIGVKQVTDDFLELDLTYNRGDLLSLRGVAREIAAVTNSAIAFSVVKNSEYPWVKNNLPETPIQVEDEKLALIQGVAKIEGLKFEKSPGEWVKKLSDSGMRSVNNIADVTNLIMLEYGQPLHAFDQTSVKDATINVRLAKQEEKITTLDGKLRKLKNTDIVLADTEKALDVAGVMGGKDTEVKESTTMILLSASLFNPTMVRKTAKRLGLHSEASKRFQHGLTKANLLQALAAAIKMYEDLGGKLTALTFVGDLEDKPKTIKLTQQKINSLLGVVIPIEQVESSLRRLGFELASQGDAWEAKMPYWRLDIDIEEDLIEEVARIYGYEKIEGKPLVDDSPVKLDQTVPKFIYDLKLKCKELGLTEVQTYSFASTAVLEALGVSKEVLIRIANPISSETEYMRMDLWPNLLEVIGKNIRGGFKDIAVFEIGKVYREEAGQPKEEYRLSIALMNGSDNPTEELGALVSSLHLKGVILNPENFHPKRIKDEIGEVHLRILNQLGIEKRVAITELLLQIP